MDLRRLNQPRAIVTNLGLAIVIAAAVYSSLRTLELSNLSIVESANVPSYEKRFEALRKILPQHGVIGYTSDESNPAGYYLANYALSPILLEQGDGPRIFIVNRTRDATTPDAAYDAAHAGGYTVRRTPDATVYDFGRGLMLVERDSQ
jgi:hypothetical protein